MKLFAGVEGGSTASSLVLLDELGNAVASVVGPATNPLLIGEKECFKRLNDMIIDAKSSARLAKEEPVESLGLCLSGCVTDEDCKIFAENFTHVNPNAAKICVAACDTIGSVYTSNCLVSTCGGWGHLFGDEGSAYWIAWRAYKTLLDDNDNYIKSIHDTKRLRQVICSHFKLASETQIGPFYQQQDKKKFASLSKELYKSTKEQHDEAINEIFYQAGRLLARKVVALLTRADEEILEAGLNIICVGSVFNSWDLLEPGFVELLSQYLQNFRLLRLKRSSAYGAAKLGAEQVKFRIPLDETTELLYAYSATSDGYLANGHHVNTTFYRNGNNHHINRNGTESKGKDSPERSYSIIGKLSSGCSIL